VIEGEGTVEDRDRRTADPGAIYGVPEDRHRVGETMRVISIFNTAESAQAARCGQLVP
jgi:hypothetical protein